MPFTWIPIYKEIARRLLDYEEKQSDLIDMVRRWSDAGIKTVKLSDIDSENRSIPLPEIDPFTFFANWNRGGDQNRLRILGELKNEWHLENPLPDEFDGIPRIFPLSSWFFLYRKDRSNEDVPSLWRLFVTAVGGDIDAAAFNHCVRMKGQARKVTMGLFWIDPERNISLDSHTRELLEKSNVDISHELANLDYDNYKSIIEKTNTKFPGKSIYELSALAYPSDKGAEKAGDKTVTPTSTSDETHYWLYAPGSRASKWDECYETNTMAMTRHQIGNLAQYSTVPEYVAALQTAFGDQRTYRNDALAYYEFVHEMKPGDIIIPKRGRSEYLGYGIVESDYYYDETKEDLQDLRKVRWIKNGVWTETVHPIVVKTLTDITKYPEYVTRLKKLIIEDDGKEELEAETTRPPHNVILYGPPGTGKTYSTVIYSVAIIERKSVEEVDREAEGDNYPAVKRRFDAYTDGGQIVFSSFHQSYSYEDFIEGIKPYVDSGSNQVSYRIEDGVFKRMCTEALYSLLASSDAGTGSVIGWSERYSIYLDDLRRRLISENPVELPTRAGGTAQVIEIAPNDTIQITTPNSARVYAVSKNRMSRLCAGSPIAKEMTDITNDIRDVIGGCNATTFWSVLNDFNEFEQTHTADTSNDELSEDVDYDTKSRLVSSGSARNLGSREYDEAKRYVMIIDEINRGNVASILGELITLIEGNKRIGMNEATTTTLPYSKSSFGVPPNLYIVGTMNTADRSVEALDTALRRRFSFVHMKPDPDRIGAIEGLEQVDVPIMLKTINDRIEKLLDEDHCIGHAYFMNWPADSFESLKRTFANRILPLLQEYFYNDAEKIGQVLGDRFVRNRNQTESEVADFAPNFGSNSDAFDEKNLYEIVNPLDFEDESPFISIYETHEDNAEDM